MATTDPTKLSSSSQIFSANYTLPQIRSIHKTLHVEIEDKASRLRTQVGSSYRDLLGTADTIVRMRGDNDAVQDLLGKLGSRCGRAVVQTKATGLATFAAKEKKIAVAEAARRKLLDGCFLAVGRMLKGKGQLDSGVTIGERLLLATKVWLLSRLLVKNLGAESRHGEEEDHKAADVEKKTLDSLRRRLRRALEKTLARVSEDSDRVDILKALCAHNLINSSGAKDALRYLLEIRSKAMVLALDAEEEEEEGQVAGEKRVKTTEDVIQALKLYTRTLLDVQALVPGKLSQSLKALTENPLLKDTSLQHLEGLRLDICEKWCSEEIRYFKPFIRHDDLQEAQAREMLTSWADKGKEVLLDNLKKTLAEMTDFKSVMELRTSVLQLWIRESGKVKGLDPLEMQNSLRGAVNARMLTVLETKVSKLDIVGSEVKATLETWQEGVTGQVPSLWDEDGYDEALSRGAAPFIEEVASRFYGRSDAVSKALNCYTSWFRVIAVVEDVVEALKKQRWDNDQDEIEDEETIEARQQVLSRDDPKMLQDKMDATLDVSFRKLEDEIKRRWQEKADDDKNGQIAMYLIRVLRDIQRQLPNRDSVADFGLVMVPSMHRKIAVSVSTPPVVTFATGSLPSRIVEGRPLWEGDPALPTQPSPQVFQFLYELAVAMADAGSDLWTPAALGILKTYVGEYLCSAWNREVESISFSNTAEPEKEDEENKEEEAKEKEGEEKVEVNEEEGNKEEKGKEVDQSTQGGDETTTSFTAEQLRDVCIQWLFDISFLRCSIGAGSAEAANGLDKLEEAVFQKTGLDDGSQQRMGKAARGYWDRTSLLFGMLV